MRELLEQIMAGEFEPGQMLPREVDLAERWGISRGVARETIRALEERGVLAVRHGSGATVTPTERWDVLDADVLRVLLAGPGARRLLGEVLESRRVLEVEAARLAAERRSDAQLLAMDGAVGALRAAKSAAARAHAELGFHRVLVQATSNRPLIQMLDSLLGAMEAAARIIGAGPQSVAEHERILAAVRGRRGTAAANAMAKHIDAVAARQEKRRGLARVG